MTTIVSDRRITKKKIESELDRIKANVKDSYQYFSDNYQRFNHYRNFVFRTSLSQDDISLLKELGKPQLEFNILEAYISRLRGEFSKQEPSLSVRASDDARNVNVQLINLIESHIRAIFFESNRDNMEYDIYTDILSGGFSALKVYTDYINEKSFNQSIYLRRCFDPTLVGFDKMARQSHKGDGEFCFELYPMTREEFERKYGNEYTDKMSFRRQNKGGNTLQQFKEFNWSYCTDNKEIVLVCDYYEKKKKKAKIVQLITGDVMTVEEYEQHVEQWNNNSLLQAPAVVGKSRETEFITICRHVVTENGTLEYNETDYKYLPLIFVDGNSIVIRNDNNGNATQLTRPYVYHAEGTQKLKNYAGCTLANELENLVQHKWVVQKEAIPSEYKEAYINVQKPSVLVYNGFKNDNPSIELRPPQAIQRPPCPPEITDTFMKADQITQSILGSYDASLGINDNQLSGVAIVEGATQSNAAAMPFIVGYLKALNRSAELILDLIPKYYITPRKIAVRNLSGNTEYASINSAGNLYMDFDSSELEIKVEAGVNFEIQQQKSLNTMVELMKISPKFNAYMSEKEGLETLLDNINIRGIDMLKQGVAQFCDKLDKQQAAAQQAQANMNPIALEQKALEQKAQKDQMEAAMKAARISIEKQDSDTNRLLALAQIGHTTDKQELSKDKIDAENARTAVDIMLKGQESNHRRAMDLLKLHHDRINSQGVQ